MTWFITRNWVVNAWSRAGWPCPWIAVHQELIASSTSIGWPSRISVNHAPWAATATTGDTASLPMEL
ncbi:Uncharacterised protein [Mycobacterium tuberculosis]|uniref:Uncharacterized protein n=1 Tax=Mycobacterium tuberculosis TaxID=1773 RepID=A0A655AR66_MYCTX|nr:Uncharacterised protein [Mycobacterium tuberculosis]CFS31362.1 Uncharacterised protein [Mycobacterium tuberculosis]CKM27715.1 Uncharacterised protein [Mycobacterium tuberculosis]CKS62967.1 Uncharacterised protein [Mycobacterium tuberculosis]CKS75845.1 Uncharacterised protein [Mycobacterium tuberculosis]